MSTSGDVSSAAVDDSPVADRSTSSLRALSVDEIVEVGLRIGLRDGFETLGMRNLSRELGVSTMALYHHVRNKRGLLAVVVDSVLREVELPTEADGDWEQRLRLLRRRNSEILARYPRLDRVIWDLPPTAEGTRLMRGYVQILLDAGLSDRDAVGVFGVLYSYGLGRAAVRGFPRDHGDADARDRAPARERHPEWPGERYEQSWPVLSPDPDGADRDLALDVIIGGVRALVARGESGTVR
jgi:AcrR family transcriptional regulator